MKRVVRSVAIYRVHVMNEFQQKIRENKNKIVRGLRLSLLLFTAMSVAVIAFTFSHRTIKALSHFNPEFLIVAFLLWGLYVIFDGIRLIFLAKAIGRRIGLLTPIGSIYTGSFLAAVTPFQISGLPLQLWILNANDGVPVGEGLSLLMMRGILMDLTIIALLPLAIKSASGVSTSTIKIIIGYIILILGIVTLVYLLVTLKPTLIERVIPKRFGALRAKVREEAFNLSNSMKLYLRQPKKKYIVLAITSSFLSVTSRSAIVPALLAGLGLKFRFYKVLFLEVLLQGSLVFTPTPGGSGVAEAVGAAVFLTVCPKYLVGILVVLWRFFTTYMNALTGGVYFLKFLSKNRIKTN